MQPYCDPMFPKSKSSHAIITLMILPFNISVHLPLNVVIRETGYRHLENVQRPSSKHPEFGNIYRETAIISERSYSTRIHGIVKVIHLNRFRQYGDDQPSVTHTEYPCASLLLPYELGLDLIIHEQMPSNSYNPPSTDSTTPAK